MADPLIDVLIPTCNRPGALAVTLACVAAQSFRALRIVVSDQSDASPPASASAEIVALRRYLSAGGIELTIKHHLPRRGMAEQRAFLLSHAQARYCLFLDDDVILEPDIVERLYATIGAQHCGFVGSALHGLSFTGDHRPHQQSVHFWTSRVSPERIRPGSVEWQRHHLHSAANLFHLQQALALADETRCYRVAWIGGCVLFDTTKLRAAGGFDFWPQLPPDHCGEDVLAQLRVMERDGGCGILPSGAYHMELPTTLPRREVDAPSVLWQ